MIEVKPGIYRDQAKGKVWEAEVYYSLGGMNYFTGNVNRRGVYVMLTPKEIAGGMQSYSLLGGNSGMKMLLQELPRKSAKILAIWQERIKAHFEEMVNKAKEAGVQAALTSLRTSLGIA